MIGHLSVEYTEGKHKDLSRAGYEGVEASYRVPCGNRMRTVRKVFSSGDPACDFANASFWLSSHGEIDCVMLSSSCDHFTMDVQGWGWYENAIGGSLIKPLKDKVEWHRVDRQFGKHKGRAAYVQEGTGMEPGKFMILDNTDGIQLVSADGKVDPPQGVFFTVEQALEHSKHVKRKVRWEME